MKNRTFIEDLLQSIGFIAAIILTLSQYFLSGHFSFLFAEHPQFFDIASITSIILSFAVILGVYSGRHTISIKKYLNSVKKNEYFSYLDQPPRQIPENTSATSKITQEDDNSKKMREPFYFTTYQLAWVAILFAVIVFFLMIYCQNIYGVTVLYVLLINLSVFSLAVFALKIYAEREYENRQKDTDQVIFGKINEYFAGKLSIRSDFTNRSNLLYPIRSIELEHAGEAYLVKVDANSPSTYFIIEKISNHDKDLTC